MYKPIDWDLLSIAFGGTPIEYDGSDVDLRHQLELSGFEDEHIDKIVNDARLLRRIIGQK